jgi:hypothetical protein
MKFTIRLTALVAALITTAAVASGYYYNGRKWGVSQAGYYVNPANNDVDEGEALAAIQSAASAWSSQSDANFSFYYMGRTSTTAVTPNGVSEVFFRNATSGNLAETYRWWNGSGNLTEADIVFYDGSFQFFGSNSGCSGGFYIEDVAVHEFGHALGLDHSSVSTATMAGGQSMCSTWKRSLDSDDIAGVQALYPPITAPTNTPPSLGIDSPSWWSSFTEGTSITFAAWAWDTQDGDISGRIRWTSSLDGTFGSGSWLTTTSLRAGTHTIVASATDNAGASSSMSITITVSAAAAPPPTEPAPTDPTPTEPTPTEPTPPQGGFSLAARGYKVKGMQRVDLQWSGAGASSVDVYRDGAFVMRTGNDGGQTDPVNVKGPGTYNYTVCDAGTTNCSNAVRVVF